jgi:LuxR family transcriptional regulator, maltose regulon positive regulatory protein
MTAMISDFPSRAPGKGMPLARAVGELLSGEIADVPVAHWAWVAAFLLGAMARDALGDSDAAGRALQRALDLAEPDQALLCAALTHGETRVLRYLPTNLSAQEIADELYLSVNTVKTHQRHVYQKLGARSRTQAVERARALGLLAPSSHGRWP